MVRAAVVEAALGLPEKEARQAQALAQLGMFRPLYKGIVVVVRKEARE